MAESNDQADRRSADVRWMALAIEAAKNGQGAVEPNPMVGCLLVADQQPIGIGWHAEFGGPHAEINALNSVKPDQQSLIAGCTAYVTLEPCSHQGKTGPCCDALITAGVGRVVVAVIDPNPEVAGQGIQKMQAAGIEVETGALESEAAETLAPYLKRTTTGLPWIIAKWAMTVDGKIATATGHSQWISNEKSRRKVHDLRRRVDAVMVGIGTALADDPMLNARPAGTRNARRVILDSTAKLPLSSKLVQTAHNHATLIAVGPDADSEKIHQYESAGCTVFKSSDADPAARLMALLRRLTELGDTNVLVEGGGQLLGSLADLKQIDELHSFIGPKLIGGQGSHSPVAGIGAETIDLGIELKLQQVERIDDDIYAIYRKQ
jgi:diaminohydroxyphosphoribosylaminopyrimidine deaminase/5-amino-6-(5-phosphoribosylamino)uracil reductase